jgi:Holliday junction DNA helicase RuvA
MIASLRGRVIGWDSGSAIIDVNGIGYRVMLSTLSLASLSEEGGEGHEVRILTSLIVRDDSIALFGFLSEHEQHLFEKLITVSGVGPKVALSALSVFNADVLQQVIVGEDVARLSTIPGIGKKTAQRIILELRGVLDADPAPKAGGGVAGAGVAATAAKATEALLSMGFTAAEAALAFKGYEGDGSDVGAMVRFGLKRLGAS